jgi:S-formylglutathione hydrolase FrmB
VGLNVLLPDTGTPPFATLYLLHGLSDDYTGWVRRSNIERYVANLPLIVVMPDGYRGFYTNTASGVPYARYIAEETVAFIERNFPARASRDARAIGGLSMGGYGALRLALGYPDCFISATSHSGVPMHGTRKPKETALWEYDQVFGPNPAGSDHDLLKLAKLAREMNLCPAIRIDCGREDPVLENNRELHAALTTLQIEHEYEEFPGAHDWDYWDLHIREAIQFHARNLNLNL